MPIRNNTVFLCSVPVAYEICHDKMEIKRKAYYFGLDSDLNCAVHKPKTKDILFSYEARKSIRKDVRREREFRGLLMLQ